VDNSSALFGGFGLKQGNLLLDLLALAFGAAEFSLFIFGNGQNQVEWFLAFFAVKFISGHGNPPAGKKLMIDSTRSVCLRLAELCWNVLNL
jgi:hypothetical protein